MALAAGANTLSAPSTRRSPTFFCPGCFLRFAARLKDASERDTDVVRSALTPFWNTCVALLLKARPEENGGELRRRLLLNHASCASESASSRANQAAAFPDLVPTVLDAACRCLHICLARGINSVYERVHRRREVFQSRNGRWPSTTDELFPAGPDATLGALVLWGHKITSASPIAVLSDIIGIALPVVLEALSQSMELRASLIKLMIARLRGAKTYSLDSIPSRYTARSLVESARGSGVRAVAYLLRPLQPGRDAGAAHLLSVVRGHESELFPAVLDAIAFIDDSPNMEAPYQALASVANALQARLALNISVLPPPVIACRRSAMSMADVVVCFLCTLRTQGRRRCAGQDCQLFVHRLEPVFCPGCLTFSFCSAACRQRSFEAGHKRVCSAVSRLMDSCDYEKVFADCRLWEQLHLYTFALTQNDLHKKLRKRADDLFQPCAQLGFAFLKLWLKSIDPAASNSS